MIKSLYSLTLFTALAAIPLHAAERVLDLKQAKKQEVHHSMMGFRNTLIFYTFAEQQAVVTVQIDNKDTSFPVKAKVHLFDPSTSAEGLGKWINNQYSDGLFPEVPRPTTTDLSKSACAVTAHKLTGTEQNPSPVRAGTYKKYDVTLSGKGHTEAGKFKLTPVKDNATVYVHVPKL